MAQEDILGERIVEYAPTAADDGLALARHVVSETEAGSKIGGGFVVELTGGEPPLDSPDRTGRTGCSSRRRRRSNPSVCRSSKSDDWSSGGCLVCRVRGYFQ